jgi:hypothetical protein
MLEIHCLSDLMPAKRFLTLSVLSVSSRLIHFGFVIQNALMQLTLI